MRYYRAVSFCSSLSEISRNIEKELIEFSQITDNEALLFDLRLIMNELLINAGKHGNDWDQEKCINYEIFCTDDYIELLVEDEGKGLDKCKPYDPKNLASSGRGLKIVKELSDEFKVSGNKVHVKIYF